MPQIFHPSFNTISRVTIFGALVFIAGLLWLFLRIQRSDYMTQVGVARPQPVEFSHKHHAGGLGIDCRYCHWTVETNAFANVPPTQVCMNCHTQIWADSPTLAPVRESFRTGRSLRWTRVHDLPDFAYFDHSIHVAKGIGCSTCHGRVDEMPLTWRESTLQMEWCLACHRDPAKNVRPRDQVFAMDWQVPDDQAERGPELVSKYHINVPQLDDCSVCHR